MFRASQRLSSGTPKTVSATSGIGHDIGTATSFHRGLIRTAAVPIPEVADTDFGDPEDGRCDARNM
jgi:hypothetical protein